ncbi:MAG: carboxyl-terminal processing protease [Clostridia bacterium]|nr:carboxyl-terminal processing protease [Clostridia bacterium]
MFAILRKVIIIVILSAVITGTPPSALAASEDWELLNEIYNLTEENYVNQVDSDVLEEAAIRGLINSLGDPYSQYISPDEVSEFCSSVDEEYVGIGVVLQQIGDQLIIRDVIPNSPAARKGVRAGSIVVSVDGITIKGLALDKIGKLFNGEAGEYIRLTVTLPGIGTRENYSIKQEKIRPPVVNSFLMDGEVGYLYLKSFPYWAPDEIATALAELQAQDARGLILDLRGNLGGYLEAATEIASLFLLKDKPVVKIVDRNNKVEIVRSKGPGQDLPMIVLVDGQTASAAEILAGALQANNAALVLGTRTYGKGALQTVYPLSNGGVLKLTTAYYITPDNQSIEGEGLKPDVRVTAKEKPVEKALEILKEQFCDTFANESLVCQEI